MTQKKVKFSVWEYVRAFIVAVIASLSVIISNGTYPASTEIKEKLGSHTAIMIWQIRSSFKTIDYPLVIVIFFMFVAFLYLIPKINRKNIKWGIPFSLIASLFLLLCDSYAKTDSWDKLFGSTTAFVTSGLRGIGIAVISFFVFDIANRVNIEQLGENGAGNKKLFLKLFIIMAVCWVPYMIIVSPGTMNPDVKDQLAQITGNEEISWTAKTLAEKPGDILLNNHHPVFHTLLLGIFFKFGELVGSYFLGMELYGIFQCLVFAAVLTYFVIKLKEYGLPKNLQRVVFVFFTLCPLFPLWGMTYMKDTMFAIALSLVTILLYDSFRQPEKFGKKKYAALLFALLLLMVIRNNGFYLALVLLPFVIIHFRKDKKFLLKIGSVLLVAMLIFKVGYTGILFSSLGIREGSPREMLSVPFQQTARYITEYEDEITPEEEDAILTVLGGHELTLEELGKRYQPCLSDGVKTSFNKNTTTDDLVNYIKVWFAQLTKHPLVYIEAFLNLNYSWFCFDSEWDLIYYNGITDEVIPNNFEGLDNPDSLSGVRTILNQVIKGIDQIPLVNCLFEFSFYTWLYVIVFIAMLIRKRHKELLACLPIFANYMICFVGPVAYMRYALPMVVCVPLVLFITFSKKRDKSDIQINNGKINSEDNEIWIK